jgi:hypothetical protein
MNPQGSLVILATSAGVGSDRTKHDFQEDLSEILVEYALTKWESH